MAWIYIIMAGLLEIVWVIGLKYSHGFTKIIPSIVTVVIIIFSFYLLSKALHSIPLGTGYAIFTGLGTVGTVVIGMLFLGETINPLKVFFMALMTLGIIGIKINPAQPKYKKEMI
ncbi:DMT family transporter [Peribacillus butanolivorans]|uniref:DMT family transporter n=1 Tax=Peribacillus butanolivorans TaxID=421767 RepID=UPI00167F53F6|nr:multidrug efflux SMR transporter [Peribacillus butanolivorans]QNU04664.1 multidrug efflux SMR transporter [Peribacillus butanolivorans]